jgi:hypothetical protein
VGRRKPALICGVFIMLICILQLTFVPAPPYTWVTLLVFGIGPIFANVYGKTLATTTDHAAHLHQTRLFWISIVVLALIVSALLKETGSAARSGADGLAEP